MRPQKYYRAVIEWVDKQEGPFAVWEVASATFMPRPTARRILERLHKFKLLRRLASGFADRVWCKSRHWVSATQSIEDYEWLCMVEDGRKKARNFSPRERVVGEEEVQESAPSSKPTY